MRVMHACIVGGRSGDVDHTLARGIAWLHAQAIRAPPTCSLTPMCSWRWQLGGRCADCSTRIQRIPAANVCKWLALQPPLVHPTATHVRALAACGCWAQGARAHAGPGRVRPHLQDVSVAQHKSMQRHPHAHNTAASNPLPCVTYLCRRRFKNSLQVMGTSITLGHLKEGGGWSFSIESLISGSGPESKVRACALNCGWWRW
jgi:hypothetical protein